MTGLNKDRILESIEVVVNQNKIDGPMRIVNDYSIDNVSKKVLRIILSYTDYVNRTVWSKDI